MYQIHCRKSSCNSIIKSTSFSISFCSMLFARLCKTFFEGNNAQKYLVHTNWVESLFILFALFTRLASFYGPLKEFGFCQFSGLFLLNCPLRDWVIFFQHGRLLSDAINANYLPKRLFPLCHL